jgi:uncharacterized membrane protein (DUF4010 family)
MEQNLLLLRLLISGSLGLLIGIEREHLMQKEEKMMAAGIRTFTLITLLGTLSSHISTYFIWFLPLMLSGVILLNLVSYFQTSKESIGLTSEIAILIAFLVGSLVYYGEEKIAIAFTVIMVTLLSLRKISHKLVKKIKYSELLDALKFGIISLVILPFLPNQSFGPFNFFNPREIWLMVVFVSGISYVGYILTKIFDSDKGIKLSGITGGLVSSTAVTSAMSIRSKKNKNHPKSFAFATVTAFSVMFLRLMILVFFANESLFFQLFFPFSAMFVSGIVGSLVFLKKKGGVETDLELKSPFSLAPALKFGLIFTLVLFLSRISETYFGDTGLYLTSIFSGLAGNTAITLTVATMVGKSIGPQTGLATIFLALISNTVFKFMTAYMTGDREYSKLVGLMFLLILISGLITVLLV